MRFLCVGREDSTIIVGFQYYLRKVSVRVFVAKRNCLVIVSNVNTYGPRREKTCLRWFAKNTGADQPAHPRSLISAFVFRFLESITSKLVTSEVSTF